MTRHESPLSGFGSNLRLTKRPTVRVPLSSVRINQPGCPGAVS